MWWWWGIATAATLDEVWTATLAHDPGIAASAAQVEGALAGVGAARAGVLPKLVVAGGYTWNDEGIALNVDDALPPGAPPLEPIELVPPTWFDASATVVQPIVDADAWATFGAARSEAGGAEARDRAIRAEIRAGVARLYYGLLVAEEGVRIADRAVEVAARQEEVATRLWEAGAGAEYASLAARQARLAAERDRAAAEAKAIEVAEALYRRSGLRGVSPQLGGAPGVTEDLETALAEARAARPEIAAAAAELKAARSTRTAADLAFVPDVNARLTGLATQNDFVADDGLLLRATVEATWIWAGGAQSARARGASAAVAATTAAERDAIALVEEEIHVGFSELRRARAALEAAEQEVVAATEALRQAEAAFAAGAIPFVEVRRAALGHASAELSVARESAAVELAAVDLAIATGGW